MRKIFILLTFPALLLAACQTVDDKSASKGEEKPVNEATAKYNIGTFVGYSEVCAEFQGNGAGSEKTAAIKDVFRKDADFARGYAKFDNYTGFDYVTGLTDCDLVKGTLDKIYKALKEAKGTKA